MSERRPTYLLAPEVRFIGYRILHGHFQRFDDDLTAVEGFYAGDNHARGQQGAFNGIGLAIFENHIFEMSHERVKEVSGA